MISYKKNLNIVGHICKLKFIFSNCFKNEYNNTFNYSNNLQNSDKDDLLDHILSWIQLCKTVQSNPLLTWCLLSLCQHPPDIVLFVFETFLFISVRSSGSWPIRNVEGLDTWYQFTPFRYKTDSQNPTNAVHSSRPRDSQGFWGSKGCSPKITENSLSGVLLLIFPR